MNDASKTKRALIEELRELRAMLAETEGSAADSILEAPQAPGRDKQKAEIFNDALDSIVSIDHEGQIIEFNPAAERLFGYTRREVIGHEMTDLILPSSLRQKHREGLARYLATGERVILGKRVEVTAQHADGTEFDCELSIVQNRDGNHPVFTGFIRDIGERKEAEERLIASEAKYRHLVEVSPEPIGIHSGGKWVYVNPASVRLFGASGPEEIIGKPILNFVHPDYRGIVEERVHNQLEKGQPAPLVEEKLIKLDGTVIWAEVTAIPIRYDGKSALMVLARDITERKQAEEELRRKEAQYKSLSSILRLMCDNMPDMIWAKDRNSRYLFANKAMCENLLHANGTDEPIGKTDMFFAERERRSHSDDPAWHTFGEICRDSDAITLESGSVEQFDEFGNVRGKFLFLDVHKAPILDEKGDVIGVVGSGRDVTDMKNAERQLHKLSKAIEQNPVAVMITDTKGVIEYVNKKFCELTGYRPKEIIGRNPRALNSGNHSPEFYKFLWDTITSGGEWRGEIRNRKKSGELYWESTSIAPITDKEGRITNFIALKEDITKLKQAEEDKEILQAQLLQSQKLEAIGTLAGGVAHDFNNILTAIIGNAELALEKVDETAPLRRNLVNVKEAGRRAADLTRQLLLYSRKQALMFTTFNINSTIACLLKMVHRLIGENMIIETNLAPALWAMRADESNIEQVIMNLAVNARDAMAEGGVLTITTENSAIDDDYCKSTNNATPGSFIRMTFADTGTGMDRATMERIFEPFFTTKGLAKGTGLGMSVVYGIIRKHKGWINVESIVGKGTTFEVYLPASPEEAEEKAEEEVSLEELQGCGELILLVEDEEVVRGFGATVLENNGYRVLTAGSVEEASALFKREGGRFDLIFSDVVLADKDGLTLVDELLSLKPDLKIVMTSGYTDEKSKWPIIEERGYPFLQKPYAIADLLKTVNDIFQ